MIPKLHEVFLLKESPKKTSIDNMNKRAKDAWDKRWGDFVQGELDYMSKHGDPEAKEYKKALDAGKPHEAIVGDDLTVVEDGNTTVIYKRGGMGDAEWTWFWDGNRWYDDIKGGGDDDIMPAMSDDQQDQAYDILDKGMKGNFGGQFDDL